MTPHHTTTTATADSGLFYCPEHKFTPAPNSGLAMCPECEFGAGSLEAFSLLCLNAESAVMAAPSADPEPLLDDAEPIRVDLASDDPMNGATAHVLLPVRSMPMIAGIIRRYMKNFSASDASSSDTLAAFYTLAVWCDILEGTARIHAEYELEMSSSDHGGL